MDSIDLAKYQKTLESALEKGIEIHVGSNWVKAPGTVSLIWHPVLREYCLVFGTDQFNAGFVEIAKFEKDWRL